MDDDLSKLYSCSAGREVLEILEEQGFSYLVYSYAIDSDTFYFERSGVMVKIYMDYSLDNTPGTDHEIMFAYSYDVIQIANLDVMDNRNISVQRIFDGFRFSDDRVLIDFFDALDKLESKFVFIEKFNQPFANNDIFDTLATLNYLESYFKLSRFPKNRIALA